VKNLFDRPLKRKHVREELALFYATGASMKIGYQNGRYHPHRPERGKQNPARGRRFEKQKREGDA
jgi:hypothetical protein